MKQALLLLVLLMSACTSKEQSAADRLKLVVAEKFKDPQSVRFTGLKFDGVTLCGEVNGKNSFGAYVGSDKFAATDTFIHIRNEFVERDLALQGTPANPEWKNGTAGFDKFWNACQSGGTPVT